MVQGSKRRIVDGAVVTEGPVVDTGHTNDDLERLPVYEVRAVKSFLGREGYGFNATLYRIDEGSDGVERARKVAYCIDSGNGGQVDVDFYDPKSKKRLHDEEDMFAEVCRVELLQAGEKPYSKYEDMGLYLAILVDDHEDRKRVKRWCRTKTVIQTSDCKKGEYITWRRPYDDDMKAMIEKKYGKDVRILNEEFAPGSGGGKRNANATK